MTLIYVDNNTKINPEKIEWIEQKERNKKYYIVVSVAGREFELDRNLKDFMDELDRIGAALAPDKFVG